MTIDEMRAAAGECEKLARHLADVQDFGLKVQLPPTAVVHVCPSCHVPATVVVPPVGPTITAANVHRVVNAMMTAANMFNALADAGIAPPTPLPYPAPATA